MSFLYLKEFLAEWMYHSFLIQSSLDGNQGCFHVVIIMDCAFSFLSTDFISLGYIPRREIAGSQTCAKFPLRLLLLANGLKRSKSSTIHSLHSQQSSLSHLTADAVPLITVCYMATPCHGLLLVDLGLQISLSKGTWLIGCILLLDLSEISSHIHSRFQSLPVFLSLFTTF